VAGRQIGKAPFQPGDQDGIWPLLQDGLCHDLEQILDRLREFQAHQPTAWSQHLDTSAQLILDTLAVTRRCDPANE
jgi:hypothetical protein